MNRIPDGNLFDRCAVWSEPSGEYVVTKGWQVEFPDLSTSDAEQWLHLESALRQMLGAMSEEECIQVLLSTRSDFDQHLDRFDQKTTETHIAISRELRNEISNYFRERSRAQTLINTAVQIHVSSKIKPTARGFDDLFRVTRRNLEDRGNYFDMVLRGLGATPKELDDLGHYQEILRHWSPSATPVEKPDTDLTIEELCRHSDISPLNAHHGFYLDGCYAGVFVIKTFPRSTWQKTMEPFFNLTIPGLRIALNMKRLSVREEEEHDEQRDTVLAKNADKARAVAGRVKHVERIIRLQKNEVVPFRAQMIVTIYAKSPDDLDNRMGAVRAAIDRSGCQGFNPALCVSSVALFNCATPGYGPWTGYTPYWRKIDDLNLAHMFPVGSTPMAELAEADWLSCGNRDNLIGGKFFIGSQPADMLVMGSKGAGKSASLQDKVLQGAGQFGLIGIVDEHFSWMETAQLLDPTSKPIVVRANSLHTYNLFDTGQLALSPQHIRGSTSLSQLLAGKSPDEDRNTDQAAILAKAIKEIYDREFRYWRNKHPEEHYEACRTATLALRTVGKDFVDAVQWLSELKKDNPSQYAELDASLTEADAVKTSESQEFKHFVRDAAFATWTPEMFPRLFHLHNELKTQRMQKNSDPLLNPLVNHIERWLCNGEYGPIVDGVSNIDLGTKFITEASPLKVVHFELGEMSQSEAELKAVVGFLITNQMRSVIQGMPRRIRKAVIIEEMTSFLNIPNAAQIVKDYSERMRKFSCWLAYVFQQYSSLLEANAAVAKAMIGNAQTMMLLRNDNLDDIRTLDSYIRIPVPIQQAIGQFPMPEFLRGRPDAYAGFVYVQRSGSKPSFTIGRTMMSQRMEDITNSSGDRFDEKRKSLAA